MKSHPIPGFPRYTLDDDKFTVRCVRPYREHIAPHILKPWTLKHAPMGLYYTMRDVHDEAKNISISKLVYLTFGREGYALPPLPADLVPLPCFPDFMFSPSEDNVYLMQNFKGPPYAPHKVGKRVINQRGDEACRLRDELGDRHDKTLHWVRMLAKGLVAHEFRRCMENVVPGFKLPRQTRSLEDKPRKPYASRRLQEKYVPPAAPVEPVAQPTYRRIF